MPQSRGIAFQLFLSKELTDVFISRTRILGLGGRKTVMDGKKSKRCATVLPAMKYNKDPEEIDNSILYVENTSENEGNITYVLRWVVRDYERIVVGRIYRCHNIHIGKSIHNLRILKRDLREKYSYSIILDLTPSTSCAKVSFVLTGKRNKEIHPEGKGTLVHKRFFEFSKSRLPFGYRDLPALCKITVAKSVHFSVGIEKSTILRNFEALYDSELFSDVKICVEGKEFNVHKVVLAARSPVFSAMLRNETKEKSENRIEIDDSNKTAVAEMLRYLYQEKTIPLTVDLALDLLELADKYDIPALKSETVNYLKCNFSIENVLDIVVAADLHGEKDLKMEAIVFASDNLWLVLNSPKWKIFRTRVEIVDCILAYLSLEL